MNTPEFPADPSAKIKQAWANVDRLLPPDYDESVERGWVQILPEYGQVFFRSPRQQGSFWSNVVKRALGTPVESFKHHYRSTSIGTLKEWPTVTNSRWPEHVAPPKLVVSDHIYTPFNLVESSDNPIRNTWLLFRHTSYIDNEYSLYEDGFVFNFYETVEGSEPKVQLKVKHHTSVHPSYNPPSTENVDRWLVANGLPKPYSAEGKARMTDLLEFCISEAQKS